MKTLLFTLPLILASIPTVAQDCDPLVTTQQAKAKTEQIDADYERKFDALGLELQKKAGMSDEQLMKVKMAAVLNDEVINEQRDLQADMMTMMTAISKKDCATIESLAKLNHERAIKQWEISLKNMENEIKKY
ncbi:MAG TPA: hypothetical protein VGE32_17660 [Cellvibrio sp.]